MMGKSHAISGAAAWVAVTSTAPFALGLAPLPASSILLGSIVTAGAALLPDADHHNGTIARSGGAITRTAAAAVGKASGGHRHGLHSLLAIVGFYVAALFAAKWEATVPFFGLIPAGSTLMLIALLAFATKALRLQKGGAIKLWATSLVAALTLLYFAPAELAWVPMAVLVGVILHLIGDFITTGGLPLFWPVTIKPPKSIANDPVLGKIWQRNGYFALPVLGNTGSARETILVVALSAYAIVGLGFAAVDFVTSIV